MSSEQELRSYLKRVTVALQEARSRLCELETAAEPVAIVGISCRFPGGVTTPEQLWESLAQGRDGISDFPTDRGWDIDALYNPERGVPGKTYVREGGFLDAAGEFDPGFFGISRREALAMDPQQRMVLETAWEVFERAGIDPLRLRGSQTGVFVGATSGGYGPSHVDAPDNLGTYLLAGTAISVMSGRVSYNFGFHGPSVTVDTACSSSIVALHMACTSLRRRETSLALTGGVSVMGSLDPFVSFSRVRGLAANARCKPFAAGADGTSWGEGAGMLLLERLSDARRSGHPVLAVVRGSAVNSDGASNGLTAPNGPAQQQLIQQALADAGLSPGDVDAVEAHGTGTRLGDPIEAQALAATYGQDRPADRPLWLGSIKSNFGHTAAAAGVAGVIKMVMAMRHGMLPPTLHIDQPSPHVDWSSGAMRLLTEKVPWPEVGRPRRAAVSSFGISGTNGHVIVEQAPPAAEPAETKPAPHARALPCLLSARTAAALRDHARRVADHLRAHPELDLTTVGVALATTRAHLEHRAVVVAGDRSELLRRLDELSTAETLARAPARAGKIAFLFTGADGHRRGFGQQLATAFPAFAAALDEVCAELDRHLERPLRSVLFAAEDTNEAAMLDRPLFAQAASFALGVAQARLLRHWGVEPDVVAGDATGVPAMAHVSGVLSLPDAVSVVTTRARLMDRAFAEPATAAAVADKEMVGAGAPAVVRARGANSIAGDETPSIRAPRDEEVGWHELRRTAEQLTFNPPTMEIMSTSGELTTGEVRAPEYWVRQLHDPAGPAEALTVLAAHGVTAVLELGPASAHSATAGDGDHDPGAAPVVAPVLRAELSAMDSALLALGRLHEHGITPDWSAVFAPWRIGHVELPTYPFQRQRYWLTS